MTFDMLSSILLLMEDVSPGLPGITEETFPPQRTPLSEIQGRSRRLQEMMREVELDGIMATHNADVFYLSGVVQQAQVYLPVAGEPLLMVRKHLGRAQMVSELPAGRIVGVRSLRELPDLLQSSTGETALRRIGFEFDTLPVSVFQAYERALAGLGAELVDASNIFRRVRSIKSQYELDQIRHAAEV
ncbi:MAG TPA: aminopeptidase P family N-terminal domain-containing protein, partial [Chloroflexia bacterium]|nr:aminopeptidase P family N-terminal domain-containing protein [Chloroflexia bacterium]